MPQRATTTVSAPESEILVPLRQLDGKQIQLKREGESELAPFDQNLLIPLDLSRLRQIVKLVSPGC